MPAPTHVHDRRRPRETGNGGMFHRFTGSPEGPDRHILVAVRLQASAHHGDVALATASRASVVAPERDDEQEERRLEHVDRRDHQGDDERQRVGERPAGRGGEGGECEERETDAADHAGQVPLGAARFAGRGDAGGRPTEQCQAADDGGGDERGPDDRGWCGDRLDPALIPADDRPGDERKDAADQGKDRTCAGAQVSRRRPASRPSAR
jgi:hypothetical protein